MRNIAETALIILISCALQIVCTGGERNIANADALGQTSRSNDVQSVISTLSAMDKLWPQQPEEYFQSIKDAVDIVQGSANNQNAQQALRTAFISMVQKTIPTNGDVGLSIRLKCETILHCFNVKGIRNDKSTWIAIAKYIGELRSQMIPDYKNRGFLNPPGAMDSSLEKRQLAIQENERNKMTDEVQRELRESDRVLTFSLLHEAGQVSADSSQREGYIKEIKSRAHLNEDEQRQLR